MKVKTEELSKGIPHVRVDFYDVNGHLFFGEFTFYHLGGIRKFSSTNWDRIFGEWICSYRE